MRCLAGALAALALTAPAASAQAGPAATPVVGGGSFADAPLIGSGTYRDTMLPGERLYYGVRLEPGQRLHAEAALDVEPGSVDTDTAAGFAVGLQTPLREVLTVVAGVEGDTVGSTDERLDITSPTVLPASGAVGQGDYLGPGVWYLSLNLSSLQGEPARVELPVEFELEVQGEPQPDASPEPTAAKPTPTPTPEGESGEDGDGPSAGAIAGVGLLGLLVGVLGGGLAARRR